MQTVVITDTSVLINFLVIARMELLAQLTTHRFVVTEHVREEVTAHYGNQLQQLKDALASGMLDEVRVDDLDEVRLFAQLTTTGLGLGECSAIAVAVRRGLALAIDDRRAIKKISSLGHAVTVLTTVDLMVLLIQQGILTVEDADAIKVDWEINHRFRLGFSSFRQRI